MNENEQLILYPNHLIFALFPIKIIPHALRAGVFMHG